MTCHCRRTRPRRLPNVPGGNPLFLRELVAVARASNSIESLPDSVEAVIVARIDQLSANDRHFLRRVSVLGRVAPFELLGAVLDEVPHESHAIWTRVREFVAPTVPAISCSTMPSSATAPTTVSPTGSGASCIRTRPRRYVGRPESSRRNRQSSCRFTTSTHSATSRLGPIRSQQRSARKPSTRTLRRLSPMSAPLLAGRRLQLSKTELASVHEALGDARNRSGAYVEAAAAYRAARRLVVDDVVADARLALKLARVQGWLDRYASVLRWITKGLNVLKGHQSDEAAHQRAELLALVRPLLPRPGATPAAPSNGAPSQ